MASKPTYRPLNTHEVKAIKATLAKCLATEGSRSNVQYWYERDVPRLLADVEELRGALYRELWKAK